MDKVNNLFGQVQVTKVNSVQVAALEQQQDVYIAKVNNGSVDKIGIIAMVPHNSDAMSFNVLSQVDWHSLHVRSYNNEKTLIQALSKVASESQIAKLDIQRIGLGVDWGNDDDVELVTERVSVTSSTYSASLPFQVTLHSRYSDNKFGNELENIIELIPALNTYNITLVK